MDLILVLFRISLSAVFGVAGITKLIDQRGTREAVKNFGAPEPLVSALSFVLPLAELLIAAGLLFRTTLHASAVGAIVLLSILVIAIGVNLARGRTHDCHCFGQLYSRPLGWSTLVRNLIFALAAGVVLLRASTQPSIHTILAQLTATQWLLSLVIVGLAVVALFYAQRRHKAQTAKAAAMPRGLPVDSVAPPFELRAYAGGKVSLTHLLNAGKPLLLIFTNPTCGPCVALFEEVKNWQESHSEQLTIALISFGTIKQNFVNVARNGLGQVLLQEQREVAEKYGANVTPTAVLISTSGRIASPLAAGADEIRNLLKTVLGNSTEAIEQATV